MSYVLVTGAVNGIGKAIADVYLENGYKVIALDVVLSDERENLISFKIDITKEDDLLEVLQFIQSNKISLDLIINVAGIHKMASLVESDFNDLKKVIDINLLGTMLVNKIFFQCLNEKGKIIITTSEVASYDPLPYNGLYSISKIALDAYAHSLRQELNLLGYQVVTIRPGAVDTKLSAGSLEDTERLVNDTVLFKKQSVHFLNLVKKFTGKKIKPLKLAKKIYKIGNKKHPKLIYKINQSLGLRLLAILIKALLNRKQKK